MRIGILGTGVVGKTLGHKFAKLGNDVKVGSRKAGGEKARTWVKDTGGKSSEGTFAKAAAHGKMAIKCTAGANAAGARNLEGKTSMLPTRSTSPKGCLPHSSFATPTLG